MILLSFFTGGDNGEAYFYRRKTEKVLKPEARKTDSVNIGTAYTT